MIEIVLFILKTCVTVYIVNYFLTFYLYCSKVQMHFSAASEHIPVHMDTTFSVDSDCLRYISALSQFLLQIVTFPLVQIGLNKSYF